VNWNFWDVPVPLGRWGFGRLVRRAKHLWKVQWLLPWKSRAVVNWGLVVEVILIFFTAAIML
jgi:hypothetical protein